MAKNGKEEKEHETPGTRIRIGVDLTAEDAERMKKAFANGDLDYLGVTGISFGTSPEQSADKEKAVVWTREEIQKLIKQEGDDTPIR